MMINKAIPAKLEAYLDKLWSLVFDEGSSGLLSPDMISREGSDWETVRNLELRYIEQARNDLKAVKQGRKVFDQRGFIVDAPEAPLLDEKVKISSIIEQEYNPAADEVEVRLGAGRLFNIIHSEAKVRELERSLNIRKVAILAEREARHRFDGFCSEREVEDDWVSRWRDYAQNAYSEPLQLLWAKVIAIEVMKPGSISTHTLDFIRHLSPADGEMIKIIGRLSFGEFIYREASSYFTRDIHSPMFETLEDLGLIDGVKRGDFWKDMSVQDFQGQIKQEPQALLQCFNKAILMQAKAEQAEMRIPVYFVTRLGRQVFSVLAEDADMAYLWAVAHDIKQKGFGVDIGDCIDMQGKSTSFKHKLSL